MTIIQDSYPDHLAVCFGCGRLNALGHRLESRWNGESAVATFQPKPFHTAFPGYVYGGLLASLMDCHGIATAAAAAAQAEGGALADNPRYRFVTGGLEVRFRRPTPIGVELKLIGRPVEIGSRRCVVNIEVYAEEELRVQGKVIAVRMPENFLDR